MLTRRLFLASTTFTAFAAPAILRAAVEDPLELVITPDQVVAQDDIILPPITDGDFVIPERNQARVVPVQPGLTPNDIHIVGQSYNLFFILPGDRAIRYGVAIGQEGLGWTGSASIGRKVEWPNWTPTPEMIERNPAQYEQYADGMPGGPTNPLGARAIYFYQGVVDTAIRVHGTIVPSSIGSSASNGCFRMYNSHVIDLYNRVPLGATAYAY